MNGNREEHDGVAAPYPPGAGGREPEELAPWSDDPSRRAFLRLLGFSLAATGTAGCLPKPVQQAIPAVELDEVVIPGRAVHYATTCGGCAAGCGLLVKCRDGRPIKVEGNPDSPLSGGGTCAIGQATVLGLYDRSRLDGPRWRGEAVSWEIADERIGGHLEAIRRRGGKVALLSTSVTSPSTERLIGEFLAGFAASVHVTYEPLSTVAIRRAARLCFGEAVLPRYRFERAERIVSFAADFLSTWISPVEFARGYGLGRRPGGGSPMSRHVQVESHLSLTGANADHRIAASPQRTARLLRELYRQVAVLAGWRAAADGDDPGEAAGSRDAKLVAGLADDLWRHRGRSLVVCGLNDVGLQTAVFGINAALGNLGETVDLAQPSRQSTGDEAAMDELLAEMREGRAMALLLYGVNPLYDHPRPQDFRDGLRQVALTVSFAERMDETAAEVTAVCPDLHFLESWGDVRPATGLFSLVQPVVSPLLGSRSAQESLLRWMGRPADFYGYLRDGWRRHLFPRVAAEGGHDAAAFETFWQRALQDGYAWVPEPPLQLAAFPHHQLGPAPEDAATGTTPAELTLVLHASAALRDGRHANNPWLQELPDPIARTTWGNHLALPPRHAVALGLSDGDVVELWVGERSVELPVLLQPGQAPGTAALALGYGRLAAGPAGNGVGANGFSLVQRRQGLASYEVPVTALRPTGRRQPLARTQTHSSTEGRPILRQAELADFRRDPRAGNEERLEEPWSLGGQREPHGHGWGMVVDLGSCIGCAACVVACQAENNVPVVGRDEVLRRREMHWIRIDRYYSGPAEDPVTAFQPMMCQHCDHAPCEQVCPVLATVQSSDGLNQQIYNRCVGTRYCANNCPYKVRRFNWFNYARNDRFDYYMNDPLGAMVLNPDVVVRSRGVMEKCSMCVQRIQEGKLQAKLADRPLADGDIRTACQQACPTQAIVFGDLLDPRSTVTRLSRDERCYHVLEELNTRPRVAYLTRIRNRGEA